MQNRVGTTVRGNDFFLREDVINRIYRRLESGSHIFINAPRRAGKTSIMYYLLDNPRENYIFIYASVQSVNSINDYYKILLEAIFKSEAINKLIKNKINVNRFSNEILVPTIFNIESVDLETKDSESNVQQGFEKILTRMDTDEQIIVLMIDEFPYATLNIAREHGNQSAANFLQINRAHRLYASKNFRFIFTGSIALPSVIGEFLPPGQAFNDLNIVEIPQLTRAQAMQMVERLFASYQVPYQIDVISYVIDRVKKLIPFNLQLVFQGIVDQYDEKRETISNIHVEEVIKHLRSDYNFLRLSEETDDVFSNHISILPFCLKTVSITAYQEIHNIDLQGIPVDVNWIFISGNNGYGKSTFLKAIAIGLFGNKEDGVNIVDDDTIEVYIEYKNSFKNITNYLGNSDFYSLDCLACYGPSRLLIQAKMSQNEVAEKSTTTYGLFNPDGILLNIESKLIEWHLEKNDRLEQVKSLFREVIPYLADIIVQKNEQDDYEVLYVERAEDDETTTFDPVPFNQLAAGFRSIIGLIGDLLIRFIRKQPDVKKLSDLAGIVLIDELENHLHPKWQYQLPTLLSKVFPNIQFIAATHSVIPILGAPKNSVFLKLNRSKEKGITVERIDIDVANLLPNSILTSPIFDMDTIRPIANEDVGQLRTEDTYDEVVANDEIDKQLRELDNDPSQYPALLQE